MLTYTVTAVSAQAATIEYEKTAPPYLFRIFRRVYIVSCQPLSDPTMVVCYPSLTTGTVF